MPTRNSVAAYLRQGLVIEPHEAVAIVQELIAAGVPLRELEAPFGPPTADSVELSSDGHVVCRHCGVTPAVSELGQLLESMLSAAGTLRAPGGLRYTIARALNDVDAPPFDSLEDLSNALGRFETSDRTVAVRRLIARAAAETVASIGATERRRTMPSPTELRRALREVDAQLYERLAAQAPPTPPVRSARRLNAIAAGVAAGLALIASGEAMHYLRTRPAARPVAASPAPPSGAGIVPLKSTDVPLISVPPPPVQDATLHAPRRAPAAARLVDHDAADPARRRLAVAQAAAVAHGAHEAVVDRVERRLLLTRDRLCEAHEAGEPLAVDRLDGGEGLVGAGASPHAPTITARRAGV